MILAETFAAVGLSTLVPAGVITLARLVKNLPPPTVPAGTTAPNPATAHAVADALSRTPAAAASTLVKAIGASLPALDLLLPKTAKIRAEFLFEGSEKAQVDYSGSAEGGGGAGGGGYFGMASVSVHAGFSALYESKSTNKITLEVDFVSVHIPL